MAEGSKLTKYRDGRWEGVPVRAYKEESARHKGVTRYELMGAAESEHALNIVVRYFEIGPGGYSSLERHEHAHAVMIIHGSGNVVLEGEISAVGPQDCVYVAPRALHQFQASESEPLGFVCIVDRIRDRPEIPSNTELEELVTRGAAVKPRSELP